MNELPYMFKINIKDYKKKISTVIKNLFLQFLKRNEFLNLLLKYNKDDLDVIKRISSIQNIKEKRMTYLMNNARYLIINFNDKLLYEVLPLKILKHCIIYEINKTKRFVNYIPYINNLTNRVELLHIISTYNIDIYTNECNILLNYSINVKLNNYYIHIIKNLNTVQLKDFKNFILNIFNNSYVEKMTNEEISKLFINICGCKFPIYSIREIKDKLNIYVDSSLLHNLKNA